MIPSERWVQIKELFLRAAQLPASGERQRLLDLACANDPNLRVEVESLLSAHDSADSFIERPAAQRSGLATAATNWIGRRLGPYRIVSEVDRGGMSEVYRAVRDDNQYQKEVAIKVLRHGFDSESLLRHLRDERQILAQLSHPHIAHLLDGGTTEEGMPYLVMEYIQGQPIDAYCEQRQLGLRERLELVRTLCSAVLYVHQHLMVHGDLKCSNVLVTEQGVVKLLDFGIAKLLNPTPALMPTDAAVMGFLALTPDCASPEQLRGEPITTASDVYSLGVLIYRLLAGRLPKDVVQDEPQGETEPSAPSAMAASGDASYKRFARHLRGELDSIILKALCKSPQERYGSIDQLSDDLYRYLVGLPVRAHGGGAVYRVGKLVRRHRAVTTALALFVISLITGVVTTSWQAHIAQLEHARAMRHFESVRKFANSYMTEVHGAIENLPGSTTARKLLIETSLRHLSELARDAGDSPSVRRDLANAYEKIGDVQGHFRGANLGDTAGAIESYRTALSIREQLFNDRAEIELQRELLRTHGKLSELLMIQNEPDLAAEHLLHVTRLATALAAAPGSTATDHRNLANAYSTLGWQRTSLGHVDEGIVHMSAAVPIYKEIVQADADDVRSWRSLALTYQRIGNALVEQTDRYDEAARYLSESLSIMDRLRSAKPDNASLTRIYAYSLVWMGDALLGQGRPDDALHMHERAYQLFDSIRVADSADLEAPFAVAYALTQMSRTLTALNEPRLALQRLDTAQMLLRGVKTDDLPESYYYSGLVYFHLGKVNAQLAAEGHLGPSIRDRYARQAREWLNKSNTAMKHATEDAILGTRAKERISEGESLSNALGQ